MKTNKLDTIFYFLSLVLLILSSGRLTAQVTWSTASTGNITVNVCQEEDTIRVIMNNVSGVDMTTDSLVAQLPTGVFFVPGSLNEVSGFNVTLVAAQSTPNKPTFTFKNLTAVGGTVNFSFRVRANCEAITHFEAGGGFRNTYTYYHDGIAEPAHNTPDYNISYPDLSFSNVNNANINTTLGATYTQQIRVTNGGNGVLTAFYVALNPPSGMTFSGATNGTLNATGDTLFFDGPDLGVDELFTSGEEIISSYQITINDCVNLSTNLELIWGCDAVPCQVASYPISATVPSEAPLIETYPSPSGVLCFDEPDLQSIVLVNTGTGLAANMIYEVFGGNSNGNPATAPNREYPIDTASITVQLGANGTPFHVSPFAVQRYTYGYCDLNNRIGRAKINLADLEVGDSIFISWTQMACCPSTGCNSGGNFNAWEYRVDYQNECETEDYTTNYRRGSVRGYDHLSFYSSVPSGPTNIQGGDTSTFILEYTSSNGLTNAANTGTLEVEVILPAGVVFSGDLSIFNRTFTCNRTPASIVQVGDTVKALFNIADIRTCIGSNGSANKAEIHVGLVADCSIPGFTGGVVNIPINTYLVLYPSCPTLCRIPYFCQTWTTEVGCPEPCDRGGIQFANFEAQRTNLGAPDNDNNGIADASGSIDLSLIRAQTLIAGDTMALLYEATIDGGISGTSFQFAYLHTKMTNMAANARRLNPIAADIQIFDASTSTIISCLASPITQNANNDFSIDINACTPAGFVFSDGDSIAINAQYRFATPFNGAVLLHEIENEFYVSNITNPVDSADKFVCNNLNSNFKTIGYYHTTCCNSTITMDGCGSQEISKNYYLSIGPCCSNYANGNYFRNEIRQFSFLDTFEFHLPAGFVMDTTVSARFNYIYTGGSRGYVNLTPIDATANPVRFVIGDFFEPRGGTYPVSDEGYYGTVRMTVRPDCNATPASTVRYTGLYTSVDATNTFFSQINSATDLLNYSGPDVTAAAITPTAVSTNDTVVWQIRIDNNANTSATNTTFINLSSATGSINVEEVRNINTGVVVPINANGIYELGGLAPSSNNLYEIVATQNSCIPDSLQVLVGWDCGDYPTSIGDYTCPLESTYLKVINPQSALQVGVIRSNIAGADSVQMCTPITYSIDLTSSQASSVKNMMLTIPSMPSGLNFVAGSVAFEYPKGSGFVAAPDPTTIGTAMQFNIANYSTELTNKGLKGTIDADSTGDRKITVRFDMQTDCDFISGDVFNVRINASRPCSDPLPSINYTVAPILIEGTGVTPYVTKMTLSADEITGCGDKNEYYYTMNILNLGPGVTTATDSILVRIPSGINYLGYNRSNPLFVNAPPAQPLVQSSTGGTNLSWQMPGGIAVGDSVLIAVRIDAPDSDNTCGRRPAEVLSLINTVIPCVASGTTCNTSTPSGRGGVDIVVSRPTLTVNIDTANSRNFQSGGNNRIQIFGTIDNTTQAVPAGDTLTVEFFCDNDGSNDYSAGDSYIGNYQTAAGLSMGGTHAFTWMDTFNVATCDLNNGDNVVALLQATPAAAPRQCACEYSERFISEIILPIDMNYFTGRVLTDDCAAQLNWQTQAEDNIAYFEVQRSTDGIAFETLTKVKSVGTSRVLQNYEWKDSKTYQAGYYYRLAIVENGGGVRYSDYVYLSIPCGDTKGKMGVLSIYPNPTTNQVNIKFAATADQVVDLKIVDVLGQTVLTRSYTVQQGVQVLSADLGSMPTGVYTIELSTADGWSKTKQLIKQ